MEENNSLKVIIFSTQHGGHGILAIEKLLSSGFFIDNLYVVTENNAKNEMLINFLKLYQIKYQYYEKTAFDFAEIVKKLNGVDIIVSVVNRIIIKSDWTKLCTLGAINLHPGLLPFYKGFFSIPWAIVNNEEYAGWSYHYITDEIDGGNIILADKVKIAANDNSFTLHFKVHLDAINHISNAIELLKQKIKGRKQKEEGNYYKVLPNEGYLDLSWSDEKIRLYDKAFFFPPFFYSLIKQNDQDIIVNDIEMLLNNIDTEREREILLIILEYFFLAWAKKTAFIRTVGY